MTALERLGLVATFAVVALGAILAAVSEGTFRDYYVVEDGPLEWLGTTLLLTGSILCTVRLVRLRSRPPLFLLATGLLGLIFIFGAGEELSWGQRLIGWESPSFFELHNAQGETNLHNLVVYGIKLNRVLFGVSLGVVVVLYFLVFPALCWKLPGAARLADRFGIPVPRVRHALSVVLLFVLASLTPSSRKGELLELGNYAIFLLAVAFPANQSRFSSPQK